MPVAVETLTRPLIPADRCDRCGAEAKMVARSEDQIRELLFCDHHVNTFREGLLSKGFYLDTETLEERN